MPFKINRLMLSAAVKTRHDSVLSLTATLVLLVRRTVRDRELEQGTGVFVSNILTAFNRTKEPERELLLVAFYVRSQANSTSSAGDMFLVGHMIRDVSIFI